MQYKTGDIGNNIQKLSRMLQRIKYPKSLYTNQLVDGEPQQLLEIVHFILLDYSTGIAKWIVELGYELQGAVDLRFLEKVFRLLSNEFHYRPGMSALQFIANGYAERKIIFTIETIRLVRERHQKMVLLNKKQNRVWRSPCKNQHVQYMNLNTKSSENRRQQILDMKMEKLHSSIPPIPVSLAYKGYQYPDSICTPPSSMASPKHADHDTLNRSNDFLNDYVVDDFHSDQHLSEDQNNDVGERLSEYENIHQKEAANDCQATVRSDGKTEYLHGSNEFEPNSKDEKSVVWMQQELGNTILLLSQKMDEMQVRFEKTTNLLIDQMHAMDQRIVAMEKAKPNSNAMEKTKISSWPPQ